MKENEELCQWLDNHLITYKIRNDIVIVPGWGRAFIQNDYNNIFHKERDGSVIFNCTENVDFLLADDINYVLFKFGDRWFYADVRQPLSELQFEVLRYIGKSPLSSHKCEYVPLGVHTGYELLNGSGLLRDWCAKAKFLGFSGIGICDKNTMAATLELQNNAYANKMGFVFGYSTDLLIGGEQIGIKIYSQTQEGFQNMLRIQKIVCVDSDCAGISEVELLNHAKGNVLVFDKWCGEWLSKNKNDLSDFCNAFDGWVYFQVDLSEYKADRIDSAVLLSIKAYFDNFYLGGLEYFSNIRPVLIQDIYYLDKEDSKSKILLNKIDTGAAHEQSDEQYMKTVDELYKDYAAIFDKDKYCDEVFYDMCESTVDIACNAKAQYDLTENYAPQYEMTDKERERYGNNLNMFRSLIEDGFHRLVPEDRKQEYRERVEYEKYIIESTNNVDYFLIQYDTINWAARNNILVGLGRGSAGGSLLLYLMGITQIDPIKYELIFERFLLPERAGLEPCEVTVLGEEKIMSENYVEIVLENGKSYMFDRDSVFKVIRDGNELELYADELKDEDEIIFDNHVLLWEL